MVMVLILAYLFAGIAIAGLMGRRVPYDTPAEAAAVALVWPLALVVFSFLGLGELVLLLSRRSK